MDYARCRRDSNHLAPTAAGRQPLVGALKIHDIEYASDCSKHIGTSELSESPEVINAFGMNNPSVTPISINLFFRVSVARAANEISN